MLACITCMCNRLRQIKVVQNLFLLNAKHFITHVRFELATVILYKYLPPCRMTHFIVGNRSVNGNDAQWDEMKISSHKLIPVFFFNYF